MLEMKEKDMTRNRWFDENLVWWYEIKIKEAKFYLKKYGKSMFLGIEEIDDVRDKYCINKMSIEERMELCRCIERNPQFDCKQLAKELFRESEYFPRI